MSTQLAIAESELQNKNQEIVTAANTLAVRDNDSYLRATTLLTAVKALQREVKATFRPIIDQAHKAHLTAIAQEAKFYNPLVSAECKLKKEICGYQAEQERKRQEEEARLREMARKMEEDRKLQEAIELEDAGLNQEANEIISEPVQAPVIILSSPIPKAEGVSVRDKWSFRIVDAAKIPREYLSVDEKKIGAIVRALKDQTRIPGIEVYKESVIAAKG